MRFEKINDDKLRIILTSKDLKDKSIDFHTFMANPIESQELFLDMLDEAEEKVGFNVKDYNLRIEAVIMSDESFILTVTRVNSQNMCTPKAKKKFTVRRKRADVNSSYAVYCFNTLDDYCNFLEAIHTCSNSIHNIAKSAVLYKYRNSYYLVLSDININHQNKLIFYSYITEFARYTNNSNLFVCKLREVGKVIIKNNALKFNFENKAKKY
jgi:adapter protein MecA 1/2